MVNFTVPHSRARVHRSTLVCVYYGTSDNRTFHFPCRAPIFLHPIRHLLLPKFSRERERHVVGRCRTAPGSPPPSAFPPGTLSTFSKCLNHCGMWSLRNSCAARATEGFRSGPRNRTRPRSGGVCCAPLPASRARSARAGSLVLSRAPLCSTPSAERAPRPSAMRALALLPCAPARPEYSRIALLEVNWREGGWGGRSSACGKSMRCR